MSGFDLLKTSSGMVLRSLLKGQMLSPPPVMTAPDPDVECAWDVKIPMQDGVLLSANIFSSKAANARGERRPVIMCAHPYDNRNVPALGNTPMGGPPLQYRVIPQVGHPKFSTLTSWESPDPDFWVAAGYTLVNLNFPGYGGSDGEPSIFSDHQGAAYFDAIEWVADQPWCTGSVGLSGVSFLAISQYQVAVCKARGGKSPRGLKAISPWEGFTDLARDFWMQGGVKEVGFTTFWWGLEIKDSLTRKKPEEIIAVEGSPPQDWVDDHPTEDSFWTAKKLLIDEIDLPMLVCGSFCDQGIHSIGSFRAFREARSAQKWVYTHRSSKWLAFYSDEVKALLRQYFDCFLKGETDNGFLDRKPVRLEVRSSRDVIHEVREETEWPLPATVWTKFFLDGDKRTLSTEPTPVRNIKQRAKRDTVRFKYVFPSDTEISGPMALHLRLSVEGGSPLADEAVLFVTVEKYDRAGQRVPFYGVLGIDNDAIARGLISTKAREIDPVRSTPWEPVLALRELQPIAPGQVVDLAIPLGPSSTFFAAGESMTVAISGSEIVTSPPIRKDNSKNRGVHVLHLGGVDGPHLLAPVQP